MKTKTEIILLVLKYLALIAAIGFSIECGTQLFYFVASLINPDWAKNGNEIERIWFHIHEYSTWYFVCAMSLAIAISGTKALIWYLIFGLLLKLQLKSPFSMLVTKKLATISYLLLGVWILMAFIGKTYGHYLAEPTGITLPAKYTGDEYFFIAGIVYIISQIFKRGIEMQEENSLTV
ncbi:MAG: DUF2975 domain-containing protein [Ginsengibacter sp.]